MNEAKTETERSKKEMEEKHEKEIKELRQEMKEAAENQSAESVQSKQYFHYCNEIIGSFGCFWSWVQTLDGQPKNFLNSVLVDMASSVVANVATNCNVLGTNPSSD